MNRSDASTILRRAVLGLGLLGGAWGAVAAAADEAERYWPEWRGPLRSGVAPQAHPPVEWGDGKNIRWKAEIPGEGKSTPIIWGDLVIVTSAVPMGREAGAALGTRAFVVMAFARGDGRLRWQRTVREARPHEGTHDDGTFASGSALTDGERIYAFFGSRGLYALDFQGQVLWEKDLGLMHTRGGFGEGASPALFGGTLVVNWDHEGDDFIVAFDAKTGGEKWRRERDEPTTWATPLVVVHDKVAQVVVGGTHRVRSYNLETGRQVWETAGLTANVIPSPVSGDGMVFTMSGFRGSMLRAVRLADARGELAGPPGIAWTYERDTPYVPSPLLYRGGLYFLKSNSGILTCLDPASGATRFSERLTALPNVYASPVAADGRIYVVGREGTTVVLEAGPALKVLATNRIDDAIDASPALADGEIYLRGRKHLYRVSIP